MNRDSEELLLKVRSELDGDTGLPEGAQVLIAWSGGPDSTALAWCMSELQKEGRIQAIAAHINHGLRPESADEARQVEIMATTLDLPLEIVALSMEPGVGVPARARKERYEALFRLARKHNCAVVMTAHTRNDQIETVLMRLLRGAGVRGLRGILSHTREGLYRPMLGVTRAEVLKLIEEQKLPTVHDPSNESPDYLRSRVRHTLLPHVTDEKPDLDDDLERLAEEATRLWAEIEPRLDGIEPSRALAIATLQSVPEWAQGAALERWLEVRLERSQVERLLSLATRKKPGRQSCPGGLTVHRIGPYLVAGPRQGRPDLERAFAGLIPGAEDLTRWPSPSEGGRWTLAGPFMNKKLKDQLRRLGVPSEVRNMWPILVKADEPMGPLGSPKACLPGGMPESLRLFQASATYSLLGEEGWI